MFTKYRFLEFGTPHPPSWASATSHSRAGAAEFPCCLVAKVDAGTARRDELVYLHGTRSDPILDRENSQVWRSRG